MKGKINSPFKIIPFGIRLLSSAPEKGNPMGL